MPKKITLLLFVILGLLFTTTHAQPDAPKNLKAAIDTTGHFLSVKLTWDSVSIPNRTGMMRYVVYKKYGGTTDTGKFIRQPFKLERNSYIDRFVTLGKSYSYFVTTIDTSRQQSKHSDTASITLPAAPAPGTISGLIKDSLTGAAVKNVRVSLIPVSGFHFTGVKADTSGHYRARVLPGTYLVFFEAPGYRGIYYNNAQRISNAARITVISGDSLTNINATLFSPAKQKPVTLSGTVTDSAGKPVAARVRALILHHKYFEHNFANVLTDSTGHFAIKLKSGDSVIVHAQSLNGNFEAQYYNNQSEIFSANKILLRGDTTGINFVLRLKPVLANKISGQVTKLDSLGMTSGIPAAVIAYKLRENLPARRSSSVLTDSVGNYSLTNLSPGNYIVLAIPERGYLPTYYRVDTVQTLNWRMADSLIITSNTVVSNINFVVRPVPDSGFATIGGNIKTNSGSAVGGALIYFTDENQNVVGYTTSDASGAYSMPFLSPGTYTAWVDKFFYTGSSQTNVTVNYTGAASQTADLTLTPVTVTAVNDKNTVINDYALAQNYPNPFNPSTQISFQLPQAGLVTLKIYNAIGQEVTTLVNEFRPAGKYIVTFNARNLSSGVYFYRLSSGTFEMSHKMVLLK